MTDATETTDRPAPTMAPGGLAGCAEGCGDPVFRRGRCRFHYRARTLSGLYGYRDAGPSRTRVRALRDLGWSLRRISDQSGVSFSSVYNIATGKTRWVQPETERALLALRLERSDSQRGVDPTGTVRRVRALAWMGWPCAEVARRAGCSARTLHGLKYPGQRVSAGLAARVDAVFRELHMVAGPSNLTAGKARAAGWWPPLAWDDIDDPGAVPSVGGGEAAPARGEIEHLLLAGESLEHVAARVGASFRYVEGVWCDLRRAGRVAV